MPCPKLQALVLGGGDLLVTSLIPWHISYNILVLLVFIIHFDLLALSFQLNEVGLQVVGSRAGRPFGCIRHFLRFFATTHFRRTRGVSEVLLDNLGKLHFLKF